MFVPNPGFENSWSNDISLRVFTYHLESTDVIFNIAGAARIASHGGREVLRSHDGCRVPQPQATPEGARPSPEDLAVKKRLEFADKLIRYAVAIWPCVLRSFDLMLSQTDSGLAEANQKMRTSVVQKTSQDLMDAINRSTSSNLLLPFR